LESGLSCNIIKRFNELQNYQEYEFTNLLVNIIKKDVQFFKKHPNVFKPSLLPMVWDKADSANKT